MQSSLYLTVEARAGCTFKAVVVDMLELANRLETTIHVSFNGCPLFVYPGDELVDTFARCSNEYDFYMQRRN